MGVGWVSSGWKNKINVSLHSVKVKVEVEIKVEHEKTCEISL